jgi:hypothetical protein
MIYPATPAALKDSNIRSPANQPEASLFNDSKENSF